MGAVARKEDIAEVRTQLARMGGEIMKALPAHIPPERFERVIMTAIQNNGDLLQCNRQSLWNAAMRAAQDGLLPDGREGAMVPYKGEVQWMPMIGGIRKKARNSGEIATWDVHAVYEKDFFDFELGDAPFIRHKPALETRGKLIAVYSICTLKSGEISRDVMGVEEVEKIRSISRARNGPWANPIFYPEMAKKTVARRHSKTLPTSTDLDDLIRRDDHLYEGATSNVGDVTARAERRGLASRLEALADDRSESEKQEVDHDPSTGEIREDGDGDQDSGSDDRGEGGGKQGDRAAARADGKKAGLDGVPRRKMPKDIRDHEDDQMAAAWIEGWEEGDQEASRNERD